MQQRKAIEGLPADLVVHDPVSTRDGGFHLILDGHAVPLLMMGEIVPHFLPGWRASHLYTGFAPLFLLELAHEDGRCATWFLDQRMQRLGDTVESLPGELGDLLRQKAVPVLGRLMHAILHQLRPELAPDCLAFLSVNPASRRAIAIHCLDLLVRPPLLLLETELAPCSLLFRGEEGGALRAISRAHLAAGLAEDFQDRLTAALGDGVLSWPSPVDGTMLRAQGCLCFDDFHFAVRFADRAHGLVFFVMVGDHYSRVAGVWFPSLGLLVSHDALARGVGGLMLRHLPHWFVTHACQWAELLVPYLRQGAARFASVLRGRPGVHIGHQLWNELSGIDALLESRPPLLPEFIVLNAADGIELYGPIDTLFPTLRGQVNRALADIPAMIRYAYTHQVAVLRFTRAYVSARLRERLLGPVREGEAYRVARRRIAAARREAGAAVPVILLGLRVENRTLVELASCFGNLVGFIVERHSGSVIVLDGHNARGDAEGGKVIESHGESFAGRRPVEVERELVDQLRRRFAASPVRLVDTVGQPIEVSLSWADQCDCFVSIWGASLAKYRWACNRTGFVVTSRSNLMRRADLHIYDSQHFMEVPTPLRFIEPDLVEDQPEAPLLVNVAPGQASFFNFRLDEQRLFPQVGEMIEQSLAMRGAG